MQVTLDQEQYEALISLARRGCGTAERQQALTSFLASIEHANHIERSSLWIQWQEADEELPPTARFPTSWPPNQRYFLELVSRPIAQADVERVLRLQARQPVTVLVTPDPAALIGWTPVDQYFSR